MENPPQSYWTLSPTDRLDLASTPWPAEVSEDLAAVMADPQLRLLVGSAIPKLMDRALTAPRRTGRLFTEVRRDSVEPVEYEGASDGWYKDALTGDEIVHETDGRWLRVTPPPEGAFTVGELVRLNQEFDEALERLALAAEAGLLSQSQRELAAHRLGESGENLEMRIAILKLQPTPEEAMAIKRSALEILADSDDNPGAVKRRLLSLQPYPGSRS